LQRRLGRFELANRGTIFLDEVAELSPDTQAALLRVLQERELEHVGGGATIHVDVRVIAATNRDLIDAVANGTFRQDLFYRLNVFPLEMPSLRERKQDIPVLVEYFIHRYARKAHKTFRRVNKKTLDRLQSYPWPGNVRELQNVVQRMVLMTDDEMITRHNLPLDVLHATRGDARDGFHLPPTGIRLDEELEAFEKQWVTTALGQTRNTKSEAARLLGVDRNRMNYLCRKYGL
jgi:transcriptional regulator with PAS, ATPase and Fis domain